MPMRHMCWKWNGTLCCLVYVDGLAWIDDQVKPTICCSQTILYHQFDSLRGQSKSPESIFQNKKCPSTKYWMLFRIVKFIILRVGFTYLCLVISIYLVTMVILVQKFELHDCSSKYSKDTICFRAHEITSNACAFYVQYFTQNCYFVTTI